MKKHKQMNMVNRNYNKKLLLETVLQVFQSNPHKNFNYKQIYKKLNLDNQELKSVIVGVLVSLSKKGGIIEISPGKYKLTLSSEKKKGIVKSVSFSKVVVEIDSKEEVFIGLESAMFSLVGDEVMVLVFPQKKGIKRGEIVEVLSRKKKTFVGVLEQHASYFFLIPDNKKVSFDIFIPKKEVKSELLDKKVLVEVVDWSATNKNPVGKIVSVIGKIQLHESVIHSILFDYDLSPSFPNDVEAEAEKILEEIPSKEIKLRKNFRDVCTFTIDPEDAKDFDDALSVKKLEDGNWEIGVHIADVSHYVVQNGIIDKEAVKRATSVYLVDRVVPMLPEKLSNNICSLVPNQDRLCFSVVFEISPSAKIVKSWMGKTIIHSDKRFSYKEAQETLEAKHGLFYDELFVLNQIAKTLRKKRFESGSLDFKTLEMKFVLDKDNNPIKMYSKPILETNHLIEEFMLLANKSVASFVGKEKMKTFVYRVHDEPNAEKISSLSNLVKNFGFNLENSSKNKLVKSLNYLHKNIHGRPEEDMIENLIIRAMAKAVYTTKNIGHYGLGFDFYSHFTSPIRRYPDLIAHRLLEKYLSGGNSVETDSLEDLCKHCSDKERSAAMAERDSIKYMQVKYMQPNIGQIFEGIISGVTEWGLYVEIIENKCEGLVKIKSLAKDYFVYDEKHFALIGTNTKVKFQLGQKVMIKVVSADLDRKQLNFSIV